MAKNIPKILKKFFEAHSDLQSSDPLLLGLSGGPDSLCLFYGLLSLQIPFVIAHIDHAWRSESQEEARQLSLLASQHSIPFYLKRLDDNHMKGNLENACRNERYAFFKEIAHDTHAQGVVLGHHADDQSETVLKRIAEGSCLVNLSGLKAVTFIDGLKIFRPLLSLSKNQILDWLESDKTRFAYVKDYTNEDISFLRARTRLKILPGLSKEFGKKIEPSLIAIAEEANELREYLDAKVDPLLSKVNKSSLGYYLDLSELDIESIVILKHLIRTICKFEKFFISREILNGMAESLLKKNSHCQYQMGDRHIRIDRQRLFITKVK